jgi:transcriptional regulator with XRE-family HTH domain
MRAADLRDSLRVMAPTPGSDVPRRLVAARKRLGWSREALAYHSGLSWSAIAQIESGRRPGPRPDTLVALARALGVTVGHLVGDGAPRTMLAHRALVYDSDAAFLDAVVPFVSAGVEQAEPVLVVTSKANAELLRSELASADGVRIEDSSGWYGSPLATVTAYRAYVNEMTDADAAWIRIVGEPVWPGTSHRDVARWETYESLFNLIFEVAPLTVVCPYDARALHGSILECAGRTHPCLVEGSRVTTNDEYVEPELLVLDR